MAFLKKIGKSIIDFLYPPLCLHCHQVRENGCPTFCQGCLQRLVPIDPFSRCPQCFSSDFDEETEQCCQKCLEEPPIVDKVAAVFDYDGPAASLIKQLKYQGQPYLAKGAAAYLAAQFLALEWPFPDCIIPMPMARLREIERGYNQSMLLAEALGKLLKRPVCNALKRQGGDYSQAGLNHQQRMSLQGGTFMVKRAAQFHDKHLLLVDDVMTTGRSLHCCAEALQECSPKSIYALTVCRAQ